MTDLPTLPKAAYNLDLSDGHPVVAYSVQQMYDFARAAQRPSALDVLEDLLTYCAEQNANQGDPATDDPRVTAAAAALAREQEAQPAAQEPAATQKGTP